MLVRQRLLELWKVQLSKLLLLALYGNYMNKWDITWMSCPKRRADLWVKFMEEEDGKE